MDRQSQPNKTRHHFKSRQEYQEYKARMRKRRRQQRILIFSTMLILCTIFIVGAVWGITTLINKAAGKDAKVPGDSLGAISVNDETESVPPTTVETEPETERPAVAAITADQIYSRYVLLVRLKDGQVVFEKNSQERMYPASLTKIMTAFVVLDSYSDLDMLMTVPAEIFDRLYAENASVAGFSPYEEVTVRDLLYGVMLPSGADASLTLAMNIAGSEEAFVEKMNQMAAKLGMTSTNFTNVCGLHDDNLYTTAQDMAVLLEIALNNSTFREIFTTATYTTAPTNINAEGIVFFSTMFAKMETNVFDGGQITGGKTGYTPEAGLCLASVAQVNGEEYILITCGAEGNHYTEQFNITDAINIYGSIE